MENNLKSLTRIGIEKKLLFLVAEDWYFCSHRLPLAVMARCAGYEVTVVTRVSCYADVIEKAGLRLVPLKRLQRGSFNPFRELSVVLELLSIYRREKPDLVHHVAVKPVLYGSIAARLAGIPRIVNALAGLGFMFSSDRFLIRRLKSFFVLLLRLLLKGKKDNSMIVQNSDDRRVVVEHGIVDANNVFLIRGVGVDVALYCIKCRRNEVPVVMLAARMLWDKGVGEFVEAAKRVKQHCHVRFVLVGDTDPENPAAIPRETLEKWNSEKWVEWWGYQEDMPKIISQADIVCLPSYHEGVPKVLLEAMACGKAIVATDIPGCREVIHNGENGVLVPLRDPVSLANVLEQLLNDNEEVARMGATGREMVESKFSTGVINVEVLQVYEELLSFRE